MEYSVEKSDLHTSVERKIEELQLSVEQYVFISVPQAPVGPVSAGSAKDSGQGVCAGFSIREKLEENLVNSMDGPDGQQATEEDTPVLMFKIASKSKKRSQTPQGHRGKVIHQVFLEGSGLWGWRTWEVFLHM